MSEKLKALSEREENFFYCQLESLKATKDYLRGGRCVRFIGIKEFDIPNIDSNEGLESYVIDIDLWTLMKQLFNLKLNRLSFINSKYLKHIDQLDSSVEFASLWFKLSLEPSSQGVSYIYRAFSGSDPEFLNIRSVEIWNGIQSQPFLRPNKTIKTEYINLNSEIEDERNSSSSEFVAANNNPFILEAFHVGQGMCSLVHNNNEGVLLDAGAGKPVTRENYRNAKIKNDLEVQISKLDSVNIIISHADLDHWRLLEWDSELAKKVNNIYIPDGSSSLALKDKSIIGKLVSASDFQINLTVGQRLLSFRSDPITSDRNNECLVTLFIKNKQIALIAGDYVYDFFKSDKNQFISKIHNHKFSTVIVPHHGDAASAVSIVAPLAPQKATAFFSAGNHKGYKHPTNASLDEHQKMGFINILPILTGDIISRTLM